MSKFFENIAGSKKPSKAKKWKIATFVCLALFCGSCFLLAGVIFMNQREKENFGFVSVNGYKKEFIIWTDFNRQIKLIELDLHQKFGLSRNYALDLYLKDYKLDSERSLSQYKFLPSPTNIPQVNFHVRQISCVNDPNEPVLPDWVTLPLKFRVNKSKLETFDVLQGNEVYHVKHYMDLANKDIFVYVNGKGVDLNRKFADYRLCVNSTIDIRALD